MEWLSAIKKTIDYLEDNLLSDDRYEVAKHVGISSVYLNKGFEIMTGYSISEYVRNRKLYLAALDVIKSDKKIIDIAYCYGFETPESFTKAFSRFHGITPLNLRKSPSKVKVFLPLTFHIEIKGGNKMDVRFEIVPSMKLIGIDKRINYENSYKEVPDFWKDVFCKNLSLVWTEGYIPKTDLEKACLDNCIGRYGCSFSVNELQFDYAICGQYVSGAVPDGLKLYEISEGLYAKFTCVGPMPASIQTIYTEIFKNWLPGNPKYELRDAPVLEYYPNGDCSCSKYVCEIWLPVKEK